MKPFILLSAVFVMCCHLICAQAGSWELLTTGTTKTIRDIHFTNSLTGYAVGDDSLFLKTTNGGDTWQQLSFPDTAEPLGNEGILSSVYFTSASTGMVTYKFTQKVIKTTDGGITWNPVNGEPGALCYPHRMVFDGPDEGFMAGRGCFGGAYISAFSTANWDYAVLAHFDVNDQAGLAAVTKDVDDEVIMAVGPDGLVIKAPLDLSVIDVVAIDDTSNLTAIDYAGNNTFYIGTSDLVNDILISTDGGLSFYADSTYSVGVYTPQVNELDFIIPTWGVVACTAVDGGLIMMKQGNTWTEQFTEYALLAAHAVDTTLAFAAGEHGTIYRYRAGNMATIQETSTNTVNIYPNPASAGEWVTLQLPAGVEAGMVDILDMQGRSLYNSPNGKAGFMCPALKAGMYVLHIQAGTHQLVTRLIIQ